LEAIGEAGDEARELLLGELDMDMVFWLKREALSA